MNMVQLNYSICMDFHIGVHLLRRLQIAAIVVVIFVLLFSVVIKFPADFKKQHNHFPLI